MRPFRKGAEHMVPDDGSCECCDSQLAIWWDGFKLSPRCILQYEIGYWSGRLREYRRGRQ